MLLAQHPLFLKPRLPRADRCFHFGFLGAGLCKLLPQDFRMLSAGLLLPFPLAWRYAFGKHSTECRASMLCRLPVDSLGGQCSMVYAYLMPCFF